MKRLALVLLLVAAALPAAAPAAGCSPMNCAPSGSLLGHGLFAVRPAGVTGPVVVTDLRTGAVRHRLPAGVLGGSVLVHTVGTQVYWTDARTGRPAGSIGLAHSAYLAGTSQDGKRAVLSLTTRRRSSFVIATTRATRTVTLAGANWGFDALAGSNLFLLRYVPKGYEVRRFDLASNRLDPQPLKDPGESSLIAGTPWTRTTSADGRYVFTLYVGQHGAAMVHELDVRRSVARCIDLPGTGDFNAGTSYALQLSRDGRTLWAASPGYGQIAQIDVAAARVVSAFRFRPAWQVESPAATASAVSADGQRLAVALNTDVYVIALRTKRVVHWDRTATALAFSPDGSRLWLARGGALHALRVNG